MGNLKNLQIVFDGNRNVFFRGGFIRGQVKMTVESAESIDNVKGVWIVFEGKSGLVSGRRRNQTPQFHEHYFNACLVLLGTGTGERDVTDLTLLPGSHSFPFAFQLPQQPIPSPLETRFGHVRYTATATVSFRRSLGNKVYNTVVVFNMAGPTVDLNQMAVVELGIQRTFEDRDFLGLTGRQTEVTIGLPKQGYVPGERIYVTGHVDNSSGQKQTRTFEARLVERITYIRTYHPFFQKANLAIASSRVKLRKGEKTDFGIGPLLIPPVPSTGLPGCNLIDIEYYVKVRDCKASHAVKHPVTIGTVPLREPSLHSGGEPPHDGQTKQATGQASPSRHFAATAAPVRDYMMTFEEGMKFELVDDIVQGLSAPLYNYFHMPDKPPDTSAVKV